MRRRLANLAVFLLALSFSVTASAKDGDPSDFEALLAFESPEQDLAEHWYEFRRGLVQLDREIAHGGLRSLKIERDSNSIGQFTTLSMGIRVGFDGSKVELRGWLPTEDVKRSLDTHQLRRYS